MKIGPGTQVWIVIDDTGAIRGVWNSWHHAEMQALRIKVNPETNIQVSQYLGGI